jgi:hypothetical protein
MIPVLCCVDWRASIQPGEVPCDFYESIAPTDPAARRWFDASSGVHLCKHRGTDGIGGMRHCLSKEAVLTFRSRFIKEEEWGA